MSTAQQVTLDQLHTAEAWLARMAEEPVDEWSFKPPRFYSLPEWKYTRGPAVGRLCEAAGMKPDPEQQLALDAIFSVDPLDPFGPSPVFEACLVAVRQALKTGLGKMCALGWLFIDDVKDPTQDEFIVTWSAHEFPTTWQSFKDLEAMILASPLLRSLMPPSKFKDEPVGGMRRGHGDVAIRAANGHEIRFKARTNDAGRGLTGDKIILDEAFALTASHMGSLLPTLTVVPNAQIVYLSSAGKLKSEVLREIRDRGRFGGDRALFYAEWCAEERSCRLQLLSGEWESNPDCQHPRPGTPGHKPGWCALDDEDLWAQAYPLLGRRRSNGTGLTITKLRAFRRSEPSDEWKRERLGWWDDPGVGSVFGSGNWEACLGQPESDVVASIGVAVGVNLAEASIAAASGTPERPFVGLLQYGPGVDWVLGRLVELRQEHPSARFVIDVAGPSGALVEEIQRRDHEATADWIEPELPRVVDLLNATANFYNAVRRRRLRHPGDPELTAAAEGVAKRPVRDRFLWGRAQSTSEISPLEAATLAFWGLTDETGQSAYENGGVATV